MALIHRTSTGNGTEITTVSLPVALTAQGLTITLAVAIIGFMAGGQRAEGRIAARLAAIETSDALQNVRLLSLASSLESELNRTARDRDKLAELDFKLRTIAEKVNRP